LGWKITEIFADGVPIKTSHADIPVHFVAGPIKARLTFLIIQLRGGPGAGVAL